MNRDRVFQRMRPWLGTLVQMRVEGLEERDALIAIEAAFAEVAAVHRLMSFHLRDSDLSRLHRAEPGAAVRVDSRTHEVIRCAKLVAEASDGIFDPTIAAQQVAWGFLPRPVSPFAPDAGADWRDIELVGIDQVRLRRALWLDLGGIAKGYAVDRAIDILLAAGAAQVCVEAGGDLHIAGARAENVYLRDGNGSVGRGPTAELSNGAVATSSGFGARRHRHGRWCSVHVDARSRGPADTLATASVFADRCMIADALTKVLLAAEPETSTRVLDQFGAQGRLRHADLSCVA